MLGWTPLAGTQLFADFDDGSAARDALGLLAGKPDGGTGATEGLIARGDSNKLIARELDIAETTVKIHVQHILRKLCLTSRVQAAVYATTHGIV